MQGIDLSKYAQSKRFVFVDGLSELFLPAIATKGNASADRTVVLRNGSELGGIFDGIMSAVKSLSGGKVVLIIDQLDVLLAAGGQAVTAVAIADMLMELRQVGLALSIKTSAVLIALIACTLNDPYHFGGCAFGARTTYTSRNESFQFLVECGSSGELGAWTAALRYRCGEGCQWCYKNHTG